MLFSGVNTLRRVLLPGCVVCVEVYLDHLFGLFDLLEICLIVGQVCLVIGDAEHIAVVPVYQVHLLRFVAAFAQDGLGDVVPGQLSEDADAFVLKDWRQRCSFFLRFELRLLRLGDAVIVIMASVSYLLECVGPVV